MNRKNLWRGRSDDPRNNVGVFTPADPRVSGKRNILNTPQIDLILSNGFSKERTIRRKRTGKPLSRPKTTPKETQRSSGRRRRGSEKAPVKLRIDSNPSDTSIMSPLSVVVAWTESPRGLEPLSTNT